MENSDRDIAVPAAILHDVLEDTEVTEKQLYNDFDSRIVDGVKALSKNPFLHRKDQILDSIRRLKEQPKEIQVVKLADRISNLSRQHPGWSKQKGSCSVSG
jgi:(p)ppGpp synthase/HD superfamily hydrolase